MRLWHKNFIDILPQKQLLAQWDDCCVIARNIVLDGSPKDIFVNKIMDYPIEHFLAYAKLVQNEIVRHGYLCDVKNFAQWRLRKDIPEFIDLKKDDIFYDWHTKKYFWQCYSHLEELYDCGDISKQDWARIEERMRQTILV